MKRFILSAVMVAMFGLGAMAHLTVKLTGGYDTQIYGLIDYQRNARGFWEEHKDFTTGSLDGIAYALDPSNNAMYVKTMTGNYRVSLTKDQIKEYRKSGAIKEYKGNEIGKIVEQETATLQSTYAKMNEKRELSIRDSLTNVERVLASERAKEAEVKRRDDEARSRRNAFILPTGGLSFKCIYCDHEERNAKSLKIKGITGDYIYHLAEVTGPLGAEYDMMHVYRVRADLKTSKEFNEHIRLFKDQIVKSGSVMSKDEMERFNKTEVGGLKDKIHKLAPNGYLDEVIIDCNGGQMSIEIYFTNSSMQTMSSVEFVMDYTTTSGESHTAKFNMSGPVKSFGGAEYVNERTGHPCCSSVDNITLNVKYSDGTTVSMSGPDVVINNG